MIPKTVDEANKYCYGAWAGNPEGRPYNPTRCAYPVWGGNRGMMEYQCTNKNGKGKDGLFCGIHAKKVSE